MRDVAPLRVDSDQTSSEGCFESTSEYKSCTTRLRFCCRCDPRLKLQSLSSVGVGSKFSKADLKGGVGL